VEEEYSHHPRNEHIRSMIKIAPSIASGPLTNLQLTIRELEMAGADSIHIDIEDGSFVPVMTLGVKIIKELRPLTKLPLDVHLMMVNPEWLIPELARMGVDRLSVHEEACPYPRRTLRMITEYGMTAGLAFNPKTPLPPLGFCLPYLSFVVVLSTEPEMGDCPYLPSTLDKVSEGRAQPELRNVEWVVDGGITIHTLPDVIEAGASVAVIGRGVFENGTIHENISRMKKSGLGE
jgi:ribulose-phosphate 3-epimerase